jgi:hypothetical protein
MSAVKMEESLMLLERKYKNWQRLLKVRLEDLKHKMAYECVETIQSQNG